MPDLVNEHGLTADEWCRQLDEYHEKLRNTVDGFKGYGPGSAIENTGWKAWEDYFADGYSPTDALDEDRTYWEDDE